MHSSPNYTVKNSRATHNGGISAGRRRNDNRINSLSCTGTGETWSRQAAVTERNTTRRGKPATPGQLEKSFSWPLVFVRLRAQTLPARFPSRSRTDRTRVLWLSEHTTHTQRTTQREIKEFLADSKRRAWRFATDWRIAGHRMSPPDRCRWLTPPSSSSRLDWSFRNPHPSARSSLGVPVRPTGRRVHRSPSGLPCANEKIAIWYVAYQDPWNRLDLRGGLETKVGTSVASISVVRKQECRDYGFLFAFR